MTRSPLRRLAVAGATTAALLTVTVGIVPQTAGAAPARPEAAGPRTQGPKPVDVQLLAINDFHGNLEPPSGSGGRIQTGVTTDRVRRVPWTRAASSTSPPSCAATAAGGARRTPITVAAGDLIGASPLLSAAFHDEPTIEALNLGRARLRQRRQPRVRRGRRRAAADPERRLPPGGRLRRRHARTTGAELPVPLRQRLHDRDRRAADAAVRDPQGAGRQGRLHRDDPRGHPGDRQPAGRRRASSFADEVETANRYAARAAGPQGVETIVVLLHEGGAQSGADAWTSTAATASPARSSTSPTRHGPRRSTWWSAGTPTRRTTASIDGKLVTSASSFGRLVTDIDLHDRPTHRRRAQRRREQRHRHPRRGQGPRADRR